MKLILVRHAVTAETGKKLSGRMPGIALSPQGATAAAGLAADLASQEVAALYTSPIQRCRETARLIGKPHGLKPRVLQGLVEVEYGEWSGRSLKRLYRTQSWKELMRDPVGFRFPDGETLGEVHRRTVRTLDRLAAKHGSETVLAVSHGDAIRAIVAHCLTGSVELIHRLHVSPLGVSVIEASPDHPPRLIVMNAPRL